LRGFLADGFGHSISGESVQKCGLMRQLVSHEKWGSYSRK
jgi:hypothetical protein